MEDKSRPIKPLKFVGNVKKSGGEGNHNRGRYSLHVLDLNSQGFARLGKISIEVEDIERLVKCPGSK